MHRFAKSAYARNMWRIMKEFKVLPNDPLLRSLSAMERDFIIEEMNYDNKIKEMISKGQDPNTAVEDDDEEYLKKYYSTDKKVNLLEKGDDLDDLYEQVKRHTKDKEYDIQLEKRINNAVINKQLERKKANEVIKQNWNELERRLKNKR